MYDAFQQTAVSLEKVEAIRNRIGDLFTVYDTTLDNPQPGQMRFRGIFLKDPADCYDDLRARFEQDDFTPLVRQGESGRVTLIGLPIVFDPPESDWRINLVLFILTIFATLQVGTLSEITEFDQWWQIWRGWPFSLSIMLILGAHELGHYFAARYHKVPVTLPYFIPLPFISLIGTLGAFIRLKAPVKNRRALLDVGVAGPIAGLVFAVPILFVGLATSQVAVPEPGGLLEGNSVFYALAKILVYGRFLPAGGEDVLLNGVAWAGWVGLLVTALNLIPVGQLDGGHVAYVLMGERAKQLFWPILAALAALSLFTASTMWIVWIGLLYFLGRNHAEPLDDVTELDPKRRAIAIACIVIFIFVFVPIPFTLT